MSISVTNKTTWESILYSLMDIIFLKYENRCNISFPCVSRGENHGLAVVSYLVVKYKLCTMCCRCLQPAVLEIFQEILNRELSSHSRSFYYIFLSTSSIHPTQAHTNNLVTIFNSPLIKASILSATIKKNHSAMSVLGTLSSEKIVIVPPEPEAYLSEHRQQLTYWHLYHHDLLTIKHKNGFNARDVLNVGTQKTMGVPSNGTQPVSVIRQDEGIASKTEEKKSEDPAHAATNNGNDNSALITRDPRNGAFTFSVNSEYDLLLHIQRALDQSYRSSGSAATMSNIDTAKVIMKSIDDYCFRKQWMFHVGNEKSEVIAKFLEKGIAAFVDRNKTKKGSKKNKYVCVELGTYCGYSALVLASTLQKALLKHGEDAFEFHIYTTEISSKFLNVATNIIRLSKMETYVTTILIEDDASLSETLKSYLPEDFDGIDFLLLDHAKNLYLPNLLELESTGLLRQHSYVCADNVVFNRLDDYRNHMKKWEKEKVVETSLEEMNLEYSNNLKDGMGKSETLLAIFFSIAPE